MHPILASLIALQQLDSAADAARKRIDALPAAEQAIEASLAGALAAVTAAKTQLQENQAARRELEKEVAAVDSRMARFDAHKAAVKTNHEYQALTHEIATAKTEKEAIEERILVLMEAADGVAGELKSAEAALAQAKREGDKRRSAFAVERADAEQDLTRLAVARASQIATADARSLATYEQLLKGRRGVAVAQVVHGHCTACHVRLRPHVEQQVRRNAGLVSCDSCQRILYFAAPVGGSEDATA